MGGFVSSLLPLLQIGGWSNGVWNMVFVGTENAPDSHCGLSGGQPYVTVDETPVVAEKPFLTIDDSGMFYLNIPQVTSTSSGVEWSSSSSGSSSGSTGAASGEIDQVSFSEVYVASNATDTAAMINAKLAEGLHLVLTPGIYSLDLPLKYRATIKSSSVLASPPSSRRQAHPRSQ